MATKTKLPAQSTVQKTQCENNKSNKEQRKKQQEEKEEEQVRRVYIYNIF